MAPVQTNLIWTAYAAALLALLLLATTTVLVLRAPRDAAASVTAVSVLTATAVLATVLLLPVDVALVSSTNDPVLGRRRDWATPDEVDRILYTLKVVYYTLYSLDAVLCLLVVPFVYFWYEEHDPDGQEDGTQTVLSRAWGACKYTLFFLAIVVILFLVGFFIPNARKIKEGNHLDLDYFKKLLEENRTSLCLPQHPLTSQTASAL
jgi:LMBR1 domain-containing protein 1